MDWIKNWALMHCTLGLTYCSLVWFIKVNNVLPCILLACVLCKVDLVLHIVCTGLCTSMWNGIQWMLVECTVVVTYGSSLNIAPWPHCTIPLFIAITTILLFITIKIKMNRPVLLEDFQASAGWVQDLGTLSLVLWDPRPKILTFTSLPTSVEKFWANLEGQL